VIVPAAQKAAKRWRFERYTHW